MRNDQGGNEIWGRSAAWAHRVELGRWRDVGQERLELWWQLKHAMKIQ